jgi:hypothetical protein
LCLGLPVLLAKSRYPDSPGVAGNALCGSHHGGTGYTAISRRDLCTSKTPWSSSTEAVEVTESPKRNSVLSVTPWFRPRWRGCPLVCRLGPGAVPGGSGLSLWSSYRVSGPSSSVVTPWGRAAPRRGSTHDGKPSFHGLRLRSESPLNIKAGSSRARGGTRLNGRFRETIRHGGDTAELAVTQLASPRSGNTMLPPGPEAPALVKSCERYRSNHLGSISQTPGSRRQTPRGRLPYEV